MKYVILIGDGMADYSIDELNNKTPLQAAETKWMDSIASRGNLGMVQTIPQGLAPGSDIANLNILGYDPCRYLTGRAVYEAASSGVKLDSQDVAFRCNLVTLNDSDGDSVMEDYSAGHITTPEASEIIFQIDQALGNDEIRFYPGISYRHLMVWKSGNPDIKTTPPHDISGKNISPYLPQGEGSQKLQKLMSEARTVLAESTTNRGRIAASKRPANGIWLWGQGRPINLPSFRKKFSLTGSVISAVDLIKGIGISAGLTSVSVPGATGYLDTNYRGKAEYALKELTEKDFVFLHVEAPDEASHSGDLKNKIKAIEDFDTMVVKTILEGLKQFGEYKVMVLPDHRTPICKKTHTSEPVPFAFFGTKNSSAAEQPSSALFNEPAAEKTGLFIKEGFNLIDLFIND
jgi:2,3-bisphosphoglycerate-independent phosphoglycerate mutase